MNLVPSTAAGVETSAQYELARTTDSGLCLYIRPLRREVADRIVVGSRDFGFLCGDGNNQFLLVPICEGQILKGEPKPFGDFEKADIAEVLNVLTQMSEGNGPNP